MGQKTTKSYYFTSLLGYYMDIVLKQRANVWQKKSRIIKKTRFDSA